VLVNKDASNYIQSNHVTWLLGQEVSHLGTATLMCT